MRNGMRYIFILCLFLGFASCQEDVLQPSYKGKGRLVLKDVDISAEAQQRLSPVPQALLPHRQHLN